MTPHYSAIALFCDDVREEKAGSETLVGVLSDNIRVANIPGFFYRLVLYARLHIFELKEPPTIHFRIVDEAGGIIADIAQDPEEVENIYADAMSTCVGYFGYVARIRMTPFRIEKPGIISVIVSVNGVEQVAGAIRFATEERKGP